MQSFTYNAHDILASGTGESDTYDYSGNLLTQTVNGQTTKHTYDDEDRMTSATMPSSGLTDTFTYNGLGLRVGKTDSTGSYSYVCDGASPGSPVLSDGHAVYTPGLSESRGGVSSYAASDVLGNLWFLDNSATAQTYYQDTTAFGGLSALGGTTASPFKYGGANGCQTDADTGLVLMGHRYYDTRLGRFITQDPAKAGMNWYTYARNNPTNAVDPTGLDTTFTLPASMTQAQVEAYTALNYGDGDYSVQNGKDSYTFSVATEISNNSGFGLGLGVAAQFIGGGYNHNRNYGPTSTQAKNFKGSVGYKDVLSQIAAGQKNGGVGTGTALMYSIIDGTNGTEWQLGAFGWQFTNPNNSNMGIDILNDITFNSLAYHLPQMLNYAGVPNPMDYLNPSGGGFGYALGWSSGSFGTIHQKIHLNFP